MEPNKDVSYNIYIEQCKKPTGSIITRSGFLKKQMVKLVLIRKYILCLYIKSLFYIVLTNVYSCININQVHFCPLLYDR